MTLWQSDILQSWNDVLKSELRLSIRGTSDTISKYSSCPELERKQQLLKNSFLFLANIVT